MTMTEQQMKEIGDRVAAKHGLGDKEKTSMWRCATALTLFMESHPENRQAVEVLQENKKLLDATTEFVTAIYSTGE